MRSRKTDIGELRQDPITGKWVVIVPGRGKRPNDFVEQEKSKGKEDITSIPKYKDDCPFCNLVQFPQEPVVLRLPDDPDNWQVQVFGNKYPAFIPKDEFRTRMEGPYRALEAIGYHEVLATRYHNQLDGHVNEQLLALEIEALVLRYRQLRTKLSVNYIQIIKNHGPEAGASLEHPHHQIFTVPVLPSDIGDLLHGTERYAKKNDEKAFTIILDFERSEKRRIVWENDHFTAFCPFASRVPFEVWILPRESNPFFDTIGPQQREALAETLHQVLGRISSGLHDPSLNYYIHSAPCDVTGLSCDTTEFGHFRWHIEVLPRLSKFGGFELGTGLEINTMAPEEAATFLREQTVPEPID